LRPLRFWGKERFLNIKMVKIVIGSIVLWVQILTGKRLKIAIPSVKISKFPGGPYPHIP